MKRMLIFLWAAQLGFTETIPSSVLNHEILSISYNKEWVVFVEPFHQDNLPEACEDLSRDQHSIDRLWIYDVKHHVSRLLISPNLSCTDPKSVIVQINQVGFSPDDKTLYFQTTAWKISGALHAVNIDGKNLRYLQPSKDFFVISEGPFIGDLAIAQWNDFFPYDKAGYVWYFAFTPDGKTKIDAIGPDLSSFGLADRKAEEFY